MKRFIRFLLYVLAGLGLLVVGGVLAAVGLVAMIPAAIIVILIMAWIFSEV